MMVPVSIVTWISHLVIKAPARWMSNGCNISVFMSLFFCVRLSFSVSISLSSQGFLFVGWWIRAFWKQPIRGTQQRWLKNTVPIFLYCRKCFVFLYTTLMFLLGSATLSVASWKCFVLVMFCLSMILPKLT